METPRHRSIPRTVLRTAATLLLSAHAVLAQPQSLFTFEMKDQFDQVHTDAELRQGILIVLGSDKAGSQYNPAWRQAITLTLAREGALDGVQLFDVANLKGVPGLVKGMVKKKFSKDPDERALFDWKGQFASTYGFERKVCNLAVFDRGALVHQVAVEEVEEGTLRALIEKVQGLQELE